MYIFTVRLRPAGGAYFATTVDEGKQKTDHLSTANMLKATSIDTEKKHLKFKEKYYNHEVKWIQCSYFYIGHNNISISSGTESAFFEGTQI